MSEPTYIEAVDAALLEERILEVRLAAGNNQFTIQKCGWLADICTMAIGASEWKIRAEKYLEALEYIAHAGLSARKCEDVARETLGIENADPLQDHPQLPLTT